MFEHSRFIQQQKKIYREIGYIVCPALDGEKVYFNNKGFTHLLRKNKFLRPINEQIKRLNLLHYCVEILSDTNIKATHKLIKTRKGVAEFWGLEKIINKVRIRIVIRKINRGAIHFFSIYSP